MERDEVTVFAAIPNLTVCEASLAIGGRAGLSFVFIDWQWAVLQGDMSRVAPPGSAM